MPISPYKPGRIMSPARYRALYAKFGMTQAQMATFLGVNHRSSKRFAKDGIRHAPSSAMLLYIMEHENMEPREVEAILQQMTRNDP